ncbi:MAG TPA: MFS transporter [Thermomicrobiales bacterium]|nr:MFS transporter [Thermomicrobiales bacterium]
MTTIADTPTEPRATRKEWLGLAVLALPCLLLSLDMSVLYLALPQLQADLDPSATEALWILDIYGYLIAGFLVTMGTLGDRIGRRKLLMIGGAAFGVASVLAAYAQNPAMLIAARAVLGIAGATLMPSTLALISNMFRDAGQRGTAIAVWMTSFMGGIAIGPLVGGLLLESFWWGSVFLIGVPVMVLLLVAGPFLLPEFRDADAGRLDLASVALFLAAILPVVYGIKEMAVDGLAPVGPVMIVTGLVFALFFVRRQQVVASPLLDLTLFRRRAFRAALGIMILATTFMAGMNLLITQYLQLVEGLSPLRAGVWMLPAIAVTVVGTLSGTVLARRFGPGAVLAGGALVSMVGSLLMTQVRTDGSLVLLIAAFSIVSLGLGPIGALCTELVVGSAPPERAGSASAASETSAELGFAVGVTVFGSISAAVYRGWISGDAPTETPASALSQAREGLAAALESAFSLPQPIATGLVQAARDAYVSGMVIVAACATVALVLMAVIAFRSLRDVTPPPQDPANEPAPEVRLDQSVPVASGGR